MTDVCGFNHYDSGMHNQSDLLDCSSKHDRFDQGAFTGTFSVDTVFGLITVVTGVVGTASGGLARA